MGSLFNSTSALTNIDALSNWNTSNVTDMSAMFQYTPALADASAINDWDIKAVRATAGNSSQYINYFYQMFAFPYPDSHPNFTKRSGTWNSEGTFIPDGNTVPSSTAANVTVNFSAYVRSVSFYNATYGTTHVTSSGDVARLAKNTEYIITVTTTDGHVFSSWSTTSAGTLSSATDNPTTYTVTDSATLTANTKSSEGGEGGEEEDDDDIIVPDTAHTVTVNFSERTIIAEVDQVIFSDGTTTQTVTRSGEEVYLEEGVTYTVVATFNEGFAFSSWSTASYGTLGNASSNPTTYTITDDTAITIISREDSNPSSTQSVVVSLGDEVTSVSFTASGQVTQTATRNNPVVSLALETSYTITASFSNGYELDSWDTTVGTLGDASSNPTTYTIDGAAILSVTSKASNSVNSNSSNNTNNASLNMSPQSSMSPQSFNSTNSAKPTSSTSPHIDGQTSETNNPDSPEDNPSLDSLGTTTSPQGVTNITTLESPSTEDDPHAEARTGLAIATAVATTTAGLLLVYSHYKKDNEEE